jgi:hypothetical protein
MICDPTDAFWNNSILFRDATHVRPKTLPDSWSQHGNALFCTKDTMDVEARERVRHIERPDPRSQWKEQ